LRVDPIGFYGGFNLYGYVSGNPIKYIDSLGLAEYLISWGAVSGSRKNLGGLHVYGTVIAIARNNNKLHNAVSFSGTFFGVDLGSPGGETFTEKQIFSDCQKEPDVTKVQGLSSFTSVTSSLFGDGGISWGLYNFGKLTSTSDAFSEVEGYDFGFVTAQGYTKLSSEIFEVTTKDLNSIMGLKQPNRN